MSEASQRVSQPDRWGRATFCEDIRVDQSGQLHLFGCFFSGSIIVQRFPAMLPKLGVLVEMVQSTKIPLETIAIRGFLPGAGVSDYFFEANLFERADGSIPKSHAITDYDIFPGEPIFRASTASITSPVRIKKAGRILVRGFVGDLYYPLGSIQVKATDEGELAEDEHP